MKTFVRSAVAAGVVVLASSIASADVIVGWSVPNPLPVGPPPSGATYSIGAGDQGALAAGSDFSGVHANAATVWTSPAGNGSQYSFSSNTWGIGDYYQATFSTLNYAGVSVSWDQARSSTGPVNFRVRLSINGGSSFIDLADYVVLQSGGGGSPGTWSSSTYNPLYTQVLALGPAADNVGSVIVRFEATSAPGGVSGSSRMDNIVFSGSVIPAPGAIALLGLAGLASRRRRG